MLKEYPKNKNYLVDDKGNIFSKRFKKKLTPKNNWDGYHRIQIWKNNKCNMVSWHRVVAETWVPNPDNKPYVNHIDGNKTNNNPSNLEWCTQKENIQHAWEKGLSNYKSLSYLGKVDYFGNDGKLITTYDCIRDAATDLKMSYFTVNKNIYNNGKLRNGNYFRLHENCNDYSERKYSNY